VQNNQNYFTRLAFEGDRLHRNSPREYPAEIFEFGMPGIELFMHQAGDIWRVTEKHTGLLVCMAPDMDSAQKAAHCEIDKYGAEKFAALIKETVTNLNSGLEYDYGLKVWVDPSKEIKEPEISELPDD